MPFDANLVLADNTADWTEANLVGGNDYGSPVSLTRNAGGLVVVDMLAISSTPAIGLSCVLILTEAGAATDDALTVLLQACDALAFDTGVHTLANFEVAGATHGVIVGDEAPVTVIRRFATKKRYIRIDASNVAGDNQGVVWCFIVPWAFDVL